MNLKARDTNSKNTHVLKQNYTERSPLNYGRKVKRPMKGISPIHTCTVWMNPRCPVSSHQTPLKTTRHGGRDTWTPPARREHAWPWTFLGKERDILESRSGGTRVGRWCHQGEHLTHSGRKQGNAIETRVLHRRKSDTWWMPKRSYRRGIVYRDHDTCQSVSRHRTEASPGPLLLLCPLFVVFLRLDPILDRLLDSLLYD